MSIRDRQEGFEKKFAMDEETRFKAMARRNKLLGLWAAEKLGKTDIDADAYAKEVVQADFEEAGDNDVFRKVRTDFDAAGVILSDTQIRSMMDELLATAVEQIKNN
ncbi:DUF1476 domain-containing protein [Sinorhizobium meliloti]|uniref:DUF1476 domain-containing protein n=1 Tax=Rhizobium meliloti TaxID=382 RepID=UPI000B4973D6|nr:DUF1476 domain-containing protein [Sinorhizobium meliloti]ASP86639.1 DUF1476 domain-containing protein [Sinorhizobium meliloti]MQW25839.1 DUF1476 family protein [Sinorhizobium meliloti]RVG82490.1 DUF1476 domain-containing protein [Sinorhizobium meliloti]RVI38457.1 DUF1476 domain-containing protein [Sinorhizobium meliloti]RVI47594.1 DUF1476 domain-containing protein [Sinorhizobium meliloti]